MARDIDMYKWVIKANKSRYGSYDNYLDREKTLRLKIEGKTYFEICQAIGKADSTIRKYLWQAVWHMRRIFEQDDSLPYKFKRLKPSFDETELVKYLSRKKIRYY